MPGSMLPAAVYGLQVPAGDEPVPAAPDFPATFRITMAAIDPSASPTDSSIAGPPRATLKIMRVTMDDDSSEDSDEDMEDMDDDSIEAIKARLAGAMSDSDSDSDEESDEESDSDKNGGPSDPEKTRKALLQKVIEATEDENEDMDDLPNGINGILDKGKGKAIAMSDDEEDEDDDIEIDEFVLCTLDPNQHYQQPLDITVGEDERVFFKVSGTHDIFLTGNYVLPPTEDDLDDDSEDGDYDLSPGEDEFDMDLSSEDELDNLADPRITEVASDDSDDGEAPKLVPAKGGKGKNKRAAETLDELISKEKAEAPNGEKLSKKQAKKLKNNAGVAAEAPESAIKKEAEVKNGKKVQFAKQLEQGPTPSPNNAKADGKKAEKAEKGKDAKIKKETAEAKVGVKMVDGVKVDDRKIGTGAPAKKGDRVGLRYIGKLEKTGKMFDANKKGPPFSFKLGSGEVIKGWDIGVAGMQVGGERKITIPAHLAYGSKGVPSIPPNSTLVFEIKMISVK